MERSVAENKWKEAKAWADVEVTHKKYRYRLKERQKPDSIPADGDKRLVPRFYQLKTGHCHWPVLRVDEEPAHRPMLVVPVQGPDVGASFQGLPTMEAPAEDSVGGGAKGHRKGKGSVQDPGPLRAAGGSGLPLATDVGKRVPGPAEEDAQSEASEWELREREEREEEWRLEAEEMGVEVEERLQFFPTPSFMASGEEE